MISKKLLASLALCAASAAPLSALANPIDFNAGFAYTGTSVTQFTSGGNTYVNGASPAPGINTATSLTVENPFYITSMAPTVYGAPNDFTNSVFTPFVSNGYIVNPAPNGLFTLTVPQNGAVGSLGSILFAQITGNNGDVFSFNASQDFVGGSSAPSPSNNQSSLTIDVLGNISDSQGQYLTTPASFQLIVSDTAGNLGFSGTFAAPPAVTITNVPEPGTLFLVGVGALGLGLCARKFRFTGRVSAGPARTTA